MTFVAFTVVTSLWLVGENEVQSATYKYNRAYARALAEGAVEAAKKHILRKLAHFEGIPSVGSCQIGGETLTYTIEPLYDSAGNQITVVTTDLEGVQTTLTPLKITCICFYRDKARAKVERVVNVASTALFQYMVFYGNDLEIHPGPDMILRGRVQSNEDIYVGAGSVLTVDTEHFWGQHLYRKRKDTGGDTGGTVNVKVRGEAAYQAWITGFDSTSSNWVLESQNIWKGTVKTAEHAVSAHEPPAPESINAFREDGSKGYYHDNADLVIKDKKAFFQGVEVTATLPEGTITEKTFFDGREEKNVKVTEIDMAKLGQTAYFPPNGLLYAYRGDAKPDHPYGIRLKNATEIKTNITVVSEDPVYLWGDYNTVNKKSCAIMTDAINLLSNAWDDTKANDTLPVASATTYNCAVLTGNTGTNPETGQYSGGFENLPRFHEDWTGLEATIRGSFANICESRIAKSPWVYGEDNYQAPVRIWSYDADFNSIDKLPPWTPYVHSCRNVVFRVE
jgi:hypothetical protein